jgi:hypothetical protein
MQPLIPVAGLLHPLMLLLHPPQFLPVAAMGGGNIGQGFYP